MLEIAKIANHRVFRQGPLILFEQSGNFELEHAQKATAIYSQVIAEDGFVLILLDFTHSGNIEQGSRKHLAHWGKENSQQVCIGAVGGTFMVRTTLMLLVTAIKLLSGSQPEVSFFGTREQAGAWLELQRQRLTATQAAQHKAAAR